MAQRRNWAKVPVEGDDRLLTSGRLKEEELTVVLTGVMTTAIRTRRFSTVGECQDVKGACSQAQPSLAGPETLTARNTPGAHIPAPQWPCPLRDPVLLGEEGMAKCEVTELSAVLERRLPEGGGVM